MIFVRITETLRAQAVRERVARSLQTRGLSLERRYDADGDENVPVHYEVVGTLEAAAVDDGLAQSAELVLDEADEAFAFREAILNERARAGRETAALDARLLSEYSSKRFVLMIGVDFSEVTAAYGVVRTIAESHRVVDMVRGVMGRFGGVAAEPFIYLFEDAGAAVQAALEIKTLFVEVNMAATGASLVPYSGFAIHYGDMLVVPGTNVHWGDPLNTASKLAEDQARAGELFITGPVYDRTVGMDIYHHVSIRRHVFRISKVDLACVELVTPPIDPAAIRHALVRIFGAADHDQLSAAGDKASDAGLWDLPRVAVEGGVDLPSADEPKTVLCLSLAHAASLESHGLIHFSALVLRLRHLFQPVFAEYGGEAVHTAVGATTLLFHDPEEALLAAFECVELAKLFNETSASSDVLAVGCGIATGTDVIRNTTTGAFFGQTVATAAALASCGPAIYVPLGFPASVPEAADAVDGLAFAAAPADQQPQEGTTTAMLATGRLHDYVAELPPDVLSLDDGTEAGHVMDRLLAAGRSRADEALLEARYVRPAFVVALSVAAAVVEREVGAEAAVSVLQAAHDFASQAALAAGGSAIAPLVFMFDSGGNALAAATGLCGAFQASEDLLVSAFGGVAVTFGPMLAVEGVNMHWGLPLELAGRVVANGRRLDDAVVVTEEAYAALDAKERAAAGEFNTFSLDAIPEASFLRLDRGVGSGAAGGDTVEYGGNVFVLSACLASFVHDVHLFGPVHAASTALRLRTLMDAVFAVYEPRAAVYDAEDVTAIYDDADTAVRAACEASRLVQEIDAGAGSEAAKLSVAGLGLDTGSPSLLNKRTGRMVGASVDMARFLGRKVATGGRVVLSEGVYGVVELSPVANSLRLEWIGSRIQGKRYAVASGGLSAYRVTPEAASDPALVSAAGMAMGASAEYVTVAERLAVRRMAPGADVDAIDASTRLAYARNLAVSTFGFEFAPVSAASDLVDRNAALLRLASLVEEVAASFDGHALDDFVAGFADVPSAVAAAVLVKRRVALEVDDVYYRGAVVSYGTTLTVPGSDIHWGCGSLAPLFLQYSAGSQLQQAGILLAKAAARMLPADFGEKTGHVFLPVLERGQAPAMLRLREDRGGSDGFDLIPGRHAVVLLTLGSGVDLLREHGVAEMTRIALAVRDVLRPVVNAYAPRAVSALGNTYAMLFEADSVALRAACEVSKVMGLAVRANVLQTSHVGAMTVAVDSGSGFFQSLRSGRLYGAAVDRATRLCQTAPASDRLVVTESVRLAVERLYAFGGLSYKPVGGEGGRRAFLVEGLLDAYRVDDVQPNFVLDHGEVARFRRMASDADNRPAFAREYVREAVVVTGALGLDAAWADGGASAVQATLETWTELASAALEAVGGYMVDDMQAVLASTHAAIDFAADVQARVYAHNLAVEGGRGGGAVQLRGLFVDRSEVVLVAAAHVFHGEAIDTGLAAATSLVPDAEGRPALVASFRFFEDARRDGALHSVDAESAVVDLAGAGGASVPLDCYRLVDRNAAAALVGAGPGVVGSGGGGGGGGHWVAVPDGLPVLVAVLRNYGLALGAAGRSQRRECLDGVALALKFQQIFEEASYVYKARAVTVADEVRCVAVFDHGHHALCAGLEVARVVASWNENARAALRMDASFGVATIGRAARDKLGGTLTGPRVKLARRLARLSERGSIVATIDLEEAIRSYRRFEGIQVDRRGPEAADRAGVPFLVVSGDLPRWHVHPPHALPVSSRGGPKAEALVAHLDAWLEPNVDVLDLGPRIRSAHLETGVTVLAVAFGSMGWSETGGVPDGRREGFLGVVRNVVEEHGGTELEPGLYRLDRVDWAVDCAHAIAVASARSGMDVSGLALDVGEVVAAPDSTIHWGPPVYFARELAREAAARSAPAESAAGGGLVPPPVVCSDAFRAAAEPVVRPVDSPEGGVAFDEVDSVVGRAAATPVFAVVHARIAPAVERFDGVAVLVTDMSGFTRGVRAWGIVHVASIIMQMRVAFQRVFAAYSALVATTEADDFLVIFPDVAAATAAALEARRLAAAINAARPDEALHIRLGGMGIAVDGESRGVFLDHRMGKMFGAAVSEAFEVWVVCLEWGFFFGGGGRFQGFVQEGEGGLWVW